MKNSDKTVCYRWGEQRCLSGSAIFTTNSAVLTFGNDENHTLFLLIGIPILVDTHLELAPCTETVVPGALQVPVPKSSICYVYPCECSDAKGFTWPMLQFWHTTAQFQ